MIFSVMIAITINSFATQYNPIEENSNYRDDIGRVSPVNFVIIDILNVAKVLLIIAIACLIGNMIIREFKISQEGIKISKGSYGFIGTYNIN